LAKLECLASLFLISKSLLDSASASSRPRKTNKVREMVCRGSLLRRKPACEGKADHLGVNLGGMEERVYG
jgi:hypothetical protein